MSPKKRKAEYVTTRVLSPDKFNFGAIKKIEREIISTTKHLSDGRQIQIKPKGTRILGFFLGVSLISALIIGVIYALTVLL